MGIAESATKILIVEDERIVAEEIKLNLEDFGYEVIGITSIAEESIKIVKQKKPDLVIMDIVLEGDMEGLEAADIIYNNYNVPIIYLTAHADINSINKSLKSRPFAYIMKPYEAIELKASIKVALYKHEKENRLKLSEERFRRLAENNQDMIFRISLPEGKYDFVNHSCSKITGYPPQKFYEKNLFLKELIHPDWKDYFEREWQKIVNSEPIPFLEFEIIDSSGNSKWVHQSNSYIYDDACKTSFLEGIITDITNIRDNLQISKENEENLRNIVESIKEGIIILNKDNIITFANKAAEKIVGITRERMVGKKSNEIHSLSKMDIMLTRNNDPLINSITQEMAYHKPFGKPAYIEITLIPMLLEKSYNGCLSILRDISEKRTDELRLQKSYEKSKKLLQDTVNGLVATVEIRDPYTAQHQRRVAKLARAIAREMKLESNRIDRVYTAAMLHDIGKMNIPADILGKGGKLIDAELDLIKLHPQTGYEILKTIEFPWPIARIVLQHHELLDGSGYPQGLTGDEILLEAKILCVADVTEAMSNHRPYRPQMEIESALAEIIKNKNILYDPEVVDVCINLFRNKGFSFQE